MHPERLLVRTRVASFDALAGRTARKYAARSRTTDCRLTRRSARRRRRRQEARARSHPAPMSCARAPVPTMADQDDLGPAVQMIAAGEEDDVHAPVFIDEDHGKVVADLDEEDDAPMSDLDDDEPARPPAADMEDRDAAGEDIEPPTTIPSPWSPRTPRPYFSCAWSPTDGAVFATGGGDDAAFLHRVSDGAAQRTRTSSAPPAAVTSHALRGHTDTVAGLAFNHDGSLLASAGLDGGARVARGGRLRRRSRWRARAAGWSGCGGTPRATSFWRGQRISRRGCGTRGTAR